MNTNKEAESTMISTEDWGIINEITASIYTTQPYPDLSQIIEKLKEIIPYSHSFSCLISDDNKNIEFFSYQSKDIPPAHIELYRTQYINYDFILWYSVSPKEMTFRESDIVVEKYMAESIFMKEWLEPINAYYGAVSNIVADNYSYGNICLYRSKEEGNFSDREMAILKTINHHLCLRFKDIFPKGIQRSSFDQSKSLYKSTYHLTDREFEIVQLICDGVTRKDLAERLFISGNTLKKHLNNIYSKINIKNFEELLMTVRPGIKYIK
ncbi:MAG: helix-turn-helix transcriptional regulator [Paenibacillaceae bacterium]|nr:helix-turn-helix transcriptional regulator [Paenibacillaceae bacterium]